MKRHSLLSMVFLLGIILIGLVGIPGRADAAGISGRLVNKTPKGKGVEGAEVTLTAYRNEQEAGKTPTRTDRAGRFQFQDLSAKPGDTYTVTVRYQDAEYNSERIVLQDAGATRTLEIPVYDSTTDASQISVKIHHVVFSVADGSLRAEEVLLFRNSGDKAYVGAKEVAGGRRATLQDWNLHLTTLFPEVRLKQFLEVRGADAVPPELTCALPALWKGILYDADACEAAWRLVAGWSFAEREASLEAVARRGLAADVAGRAVLPLVRELLEIARAGLVRIADGHAGKSDERGFLDPLLAIAERGRSPGEEVLARWEGAWRGSPERLIEYARY